MHTRDQCLENVVRLTVHVKPLRNETKLLCEPDGTLTMHVAAPPMKGKANRRVRKMAVQEAPNIILERAAGCWYPFEPESYRNHRNDRG